MATGQQGDFFALLSDRVKSATREGKPFFACKFRDARRTVTSMIWADSDRFVECERDWQPGMFFKIRATYEDHRKFGPQIDLHNIRFVTDSDRADGFNEADLLEQSRFEPEAMLQELRKLVDASVADDGLRQLTLTLLDRHAAKLKVLPASQRHGYPFPGGWLEHTLSVLRKCLWLVEQYRDQFADLKPPLNKDLVAAAAALHEIGRVSELEPAANPGQLPGHTVNGKLLGRLILARDLINDAARDVAELKPELVQLLGHTIMAYTTLPDGGSSRAPLIPEVLILHHADELDIQMEMYARCLRKDVATGAFTEQDPILKRQLLKKREV